MYPRAPGRGGEQLLGAAARRTGRYGAGYAAAGADRNAVAHTRRHARAHHSYLTTPEGIPTATPVPFQYTVQKGDTLLSIALRYDVSLNRILSLNNLRDEHSITIGQELLIPSSSPSAAQSSAQRAAADPALSRQVGTHTVRPGETLASIADRYEITVPELIAFNSNTITNPHVVRVDTVLLIPGLSAADVSVMNQTLYTVQEGDTLLGISQQFGVSTEAIMAANNISNADLLRVGDQLIIPQSTQ
jgi:LysM repeat protein